MGRIIRHGPRTRSKNKEEIHISSFRILHFRLEATTALQRKYPLLFPVCSPGRRHVGSRLSSLPPFSHSPVSSIAAYAISKYPISLCRFIRHSSTGALSGWSQELLRQLELNRVTLSGACPHPHSFRPTDSTEAKRFCLTSHGISSRLVTRSWRQGCRPNPWRQWSIVLWLTRSPYEPLGTNKNSSVHARTRY